MLEQIKDTKQSSISLIYGDYDDYDDNSKEDDNNFELTVRLISNEERYVPDFKELMEKLNT